MSHVSAEQPEKDRSWLRLLAFATFVVVVAGVYSFIMRDAYHPAPKPPERGVFADKFDRPRNDTALGRASGGERWTSVRGLWAVDAGKAVVSFPDRDVSLAVVGSVHFASISASLTGKARCGIVARYVDDRNYLSLERVPAYAVWNIVVVRDGVATVLGRIADPDFPVTGVTLETGARVVTATVGFSKATFVEPTTTATAKVGFIGHDLESAACTWDDMWVFQGT
jgi:hypothetical protein